VLSNRVDSRIYKEKAVQRVKREYSWDVVVDKYEKMFSDMTGKTQKNEYSN
jgi:glycosyltransferase involved in cell wall biosynthesis